MGTMLIAREVPPFGGDTMFANMYLAYETLSAGMRRLLDGVAAVNSSAKADVTKTREDRIREGAKADAKHEYVATHPVVPAEPPPAAEQPTLTETVVTEVPAEAAPVAEEAAPVAEARPAPEAVIAADSIVDATPAPPEVEAVATTEEDVTANTTATFTPG